MAYTPRRNRAEASDQCAVVRGYEYPRPQAPSYPLIAGTKCYRLFGRVREETFSRYRHHDNHLAPWERTFVSLPEHDNSYGGLPCTHLCNFEVIASPLLSSSPNSNQMDLFDAPALAYVRTAEPVID